MKEQDDDLHWPLLCSCAPVLKRKLGKVKEGKDVKQELSGKVEAILSHELNGGSHARND